ncbi:MAG TPA: hypothetical protein VFL86_22070, partial [Burkholderiaceae bacterium]|nr:hypothetical protein [Burkholderiaceae bacterium]
QVRSGRGDAATLEALGLLGDPQAVPALHHALADPALAPASALALHWITGAPLHEEVFIEDPVDEALLSPQELVAWRDEGRSPRRPDGQPYGDTKRRLSLDPQAWLHWIQGNHANWRVGRRYRLGQPCGPAEVLRCLADPQASRRLRELAAQELATRYGCTIPFEADRPVAQQRRLLARIADWIPQASGEPGAWMLNGIAQ